MTTKHHTPNTQIHNLSLSLLGIDTSVKRHGVKLVLWDEPSPLREMMSSSKCYQHVSKMLTLKYNREVSIIIKQIKQATYVPFVSYPVNTFYETNI